ncbi:hypothetical protein DFAR_2090027 [Desulfarculales bacterium]
MPSFISPRAWPFIYRPCARPCSNGGYHSSYTSTTAQPSVPTTWKRSPPPKAPLRSIHRPTCPRAGQGERFFRTVRSQFFHGFEGYTPRDINEALECWIRDVYHQRKHLSTGQAPL